MSMFMYMYSALRLLCRHFLNFLIKPLRMLCRFFVGVYIFGVCACAVEAISGFSYLLFYFFL